jgi:hypothetical protein
MMKKLVPRSTVEITNTVSVQAPVFAVGRVVVQQLENKSQAGYTKQEYREVNFSVVSQLTPSFVIRNVRVLNYSKLQTFSMTKKNVLQ